MNDTKKMRGNANHPSGKLSFSDRNRLSDGYLMRKTIATILYKIARAMLLFGLCFLIIQPLLNKLTVSLAMEKDLYDATVIAIPKNFTTENFVTASNNLDYPSGLLKTFIMALAVATLQVASATLVGYGFARYNFPLKKLWFGFAMLCIIVPPQTIMSALYLHFRFFDLFGLVTLFNGTTINMLSSPAPYLIMAAGSMGLKNGLYIYMLRQYFRTAPKELEEAAYVDGCGRIKTFIRIMLPDATSMLTSCFLFAFVWQWTDSFFSTMFLSNMKLLPYMLRGTADRLAKSFEQMYGAGFAPSTGYTQAIIATGMLMVIAPLIVLYLIAQKGFVESLSQSGIKM